LLLPLAAMGAWVARAELRRRPAFVVMLAGFVASLLLYWPSARYRMSLVPLLIMLAAVALHALFRNRQPLRGRAAMGAFACFATAAVASNLPFSHFSQGYDFESEMYYLAGRGLVSHGQSDRGLRWIEKAIAINPANAEAHNSLGVNLAKHGRFNEAAAHFREALRLRPDDAFARSNLTRVLELERERTPR
jgi:tetratricopeptide (TPR) repeat protein